MSQETVFLRLWERSHFLNNDSKNFMGFFRYQEMNISNQTFPTTHVYHKKNFHFVINFLDNQKTKRKAIRKKKWSVLKSKVPIYLFHEGYIKSEMGFLWFYAEEFVCGLWFYEGN